MDVVGRSPDRHLEPLLEGTHLLEERANHRASRGLQTPERRAGRLGQPHAPCCLEGASGAKLVGAQERRPKSREIPTKPQGEIR